MNLIANAMNLFMRREIFGFGRPLECHSKTIRQNRPRWHYINLPFKPEGQPLSVQTREPEPVNILTAMAENESVVKNQNDAERRAIALAWLEEIGMDGLLVPARQRRLSNSLSRSMS